LGDRLNEPIRTFDFVVSIFLYVLGMLDADDDDDANAKQRLCILIQRLLTDNYHCGEECDEMKVAERKRKKGRGRKV
jgi:hypothetical protein